MTRRFWLRQATWGRRPRRGSTVLGVSVGCRLTEQNGPPTQDAAPALAALLASLLLLEAKGLQELRAPLGIGQVLVALGPLDHERDLRGHLALVPEEAARTLDGDRSAREALAERARARPVADAVDQVVLHGVGQEVHELREPVGGLDEVDRVRLLGRPEVLPATRGWAFIAQLKLPS